MGVDKKASHVNHNHALVSLTQTISEVQQKCDWLKNRVISALNSLKSEQTVTQNSMIVRDIMETVDAIKLTFLTEHTKKTKLKKTAYMCSQEMGKYKLKFKNCANQLKTKTEEYEALEKQCTLLKDKCIVYEDKISRLKDLELQEMDSIRKSVQTNSSENLNTRLINQNQELLERLHREEQRSRDLDDKIITLEELKDKLGKKVLRLKMEINMLNHTKDQQGLQKAEDQGQILEVETQNKRLRQKNRELQAKADKIGIIAETYETKLSDLIDQHNKDITMLQKEVKRLKQELDGANRECLQQTKATRENQKVERQSENTLVNPESHLNSDYQLLLSENTELKLDLLSIKEQHMHLMNKYDKLKKRFHGQNLSLIKSNKTR